MSRHGWGVAVGCTCTESACVTSQVGAGWWGDCDGGVEDCSVLPSSPPVSSPCSPPAGWVVWGECRAVVGWWGDGSAWLNREGSWGAILVVRTVVVAGDGGRVHAVGGVGAGPPAEGSAAVRHVEGDGTSPSIHVEHAFHLRMERGSWW